jgi:branched-chain amino acid transport system permease protein
VDGDLLAQLTLTGVVTGSFYAVMAIGFALIIGTTGRFHFAYGVVYALAGYVIYTGCEVLGLPFFASAAIACVIAAMLGMAIEAFLYRPLERRAGGQALLGIFITALGLALVAENLIKFAWGPSDFVLLSVTQVAYAIGPVTFVNFDIGQVVTAVVVVIGMTILLRRTDLGRLILAVKSNPQLAQSGGLSPRRVFLIVFALGSVLSVLAGMWQFSKYTVSAGMGFSPTLTAFVIAFLAGLQLKPLVLAAWSLTIALAEQFVTIWFDSAWSHLVVLVGLLVYLCVLSWRTSGLSLRRRRRPAPSGSLA